MDDARNTRTERSFAEHDDAIINSPSPFTRIKYDRKQQIETFIGRERELAVLADMLASAINADTAFGVKISGPGGSGKSTLFGYFSQLVRTSELFGKAYCRIEKKDVKVSVSFIDAPKGELMSARFFWRSMMLSWDEENIDFLELFASQFALKALVVLWDKGVGHEDLRPLLARLHPNLDEELARHPVREVFDLGIYAQKLFDQVVADDGLLPRIRDAIYKGFRVLQKATITVPGGRVEQLRIDKAYIDNLLDMLHGDFDVQSRAKARLIGESDDLIKSDDQAITLINWFLDTWCWIEEKQACFVIGIDNIGYMTAELDNKEQIYSAFLQTLLQLRDRVKGFLFVLIGTTEDWDAFNKFVNSNRDYPSQLSAFFTRNVELVRLNENETRQALTDTMVKFWIARKKPLPPGNPCYPFSPDFFSYLYGLNTHKFREVLNALHQVWAHYKTTLRVVPLVRSMDMIRFVRFEIKGEQRRELAFSGLVPWEQDRALSWFEGIDSSFKAKEQSTLVEAVLAGSFETLMAEESPRQIRLVSKNAIKVVKADGESCNRIPDVYVELEPSNPFETRRAFEVQVKMHEPTKEVKLGEIESSLELLSYAKTDALLFVMTGPGLEARAIDRIKEAGLQERVLHASPLDARGKKALAFLCNYEALAGEKPSPAVIKDVLEQLFKAPWHELVDRIQNTGAYRQVAAAEGKKEKAEPQTGLDRFLAGAGSGATSHEAGTPAPVVPATPPTVAATLVPSPTAGAAGGCDPRGDEASHARQVDAGASGRAANAAVEPAAVPPAINVDAVTKKYGGVLKELEFILSETLKRRDRYKGRITKEYLKGKVPGALNDEDVTRVFSMLFKEAQKGDPQQLFRAVSKTSLEITDLGRDVYKRLRGS
ncbi:MAG: ATP-binding protein [Candidatus Lokiarchaeota archaeon]|nr:ATP-binding protein [Candidatus Lokiarchaeota archaeon]